MQIAAEHWPSILAERQASDPSRRQSALISAEAKRLLRDRPDRPIIAAGSTGSIPATAALLSAIARLPRGAVVLPGLDHHLDDESWATIGGIADDETDPVHGHPQAVLRRLVDLDLRIPRSDVRILGEASRGRDGAQPPAVGSPAPRRHHGPLVQPAVRRPYRPEPGRLRGPDPGGGG